MARLQFAYGGQPDVWLHLPLCVLRAYTRMLGIIKAETLLDQVVVTMVGSGTMKKEDANSAIRKLKKAAAGQDRPAQLSEEEKKFALRSMGITVE